ncbi:MAG: FlgD immunoglobulin-like domain containing protein [bacterium]
MKLRFALLVAVCVAAGWLLPQPANAQVESLIDTFKVLNAVAGPGDTVAMELFVVNDSVELAAISAYIKIDNSLLEWVGEWDSVSSPPNFYVKYDTLPRAQISGLFQPYAPLVMLTNYTSAGVEFGALLGAGANASIPQGRGSVIRFYLKVKDGVPIGTQTLVRPFNPFDEPGHTDPRQSQYADISGLVTVFPTMVSGTLEVDTVEAPPPDNEAPVINALAQTSYNVTPPASVGFQVSATDPDYPAQTITLSASGLPSGATFGTGGSVSGVGSVSGNFSWSPSDAQVGNYVITFQCQDSEGAFAASRSVSITVEGFITPDNDLLFSASAPAFGTPSGGIPGLNEVMLPVNLLQIADHSIYGIQFDFLYPSSVFQIDSIVATERLLDFSIYDDLGATAGRIRIVAFGLDNQTVQSGLSSAIMEFWGTVKTSAAVGEYPITFDNAWESINPNPTFPSIELDFDSSGVLIVDQHGDVNGDGRVDVGDVVAIVGYIIGTNAFSHRQFYAADVNATLTVDVNDLVAVINAIYSGASPTSEPWGGEEAELALLNGYGGAQLEASLPTDVAAIQLEIAYDPARVKVLDPELNSRSASMRMEYRDDGSGKLRVLLYPDAADAYIKAGTGTILDLPLVAEDGSTLDENDIRIVEAVASDPAANNVPVKGFGRIALPEQFSLSQNYPNPFNPQTQIEFAISQSAANKPVTLDVFNILGERVTTLLNEPLAAGLHTVTWYGRDDNGQEVASGVYFYRLRVGDVTDTKKMVLMK